MMIKILLFASILFILASEAAPAENMYVGAERCMNCHLREYDEWKGSGHAQILRKTHNRDVPLPEGYSSKNISYVIGGYRWKILFLDEDGYIITSSLRSGGKTQYNLKSKKWVDYFPGQRIPYDCGRCHTTGYSSEGHQGGRGGIIGTWKFEGVQCEACHGPGGMHASSSRTSDIKIDKTVCTHCHGTRPLDVIPVYDVFLEPYTETNQLMKSAMKNFACPDCHNPHLSSKESIKRSCESCHQKISEKYGESYMGRVGITCVDCHMPPAGMVAEGDAKTFSGDLKSHLFKIDHRREFPALLRNGQKINPGYLSVDYACMRCHSVFENRQWAAGFGMFAHRIKITTDIKIMRLQMAFSSIGFLSALIALVSALSLKGWLWPSLNKKKILSLHRHSAWITFSIYIFVSTLCIYFHFPLNNPSKALNLGWFLIHPVAGALGIVIYGGKILSVRKLKTGWKSPGLLWGIALSVFWLIQFGTAMLSYFNILKVS